MRRKTVFLIKCALSVLFVLQHGELYAEQEIEPIETRLKTHFVMQAGVSDVTVSDVQIRRFSLHPAISYFLQRNIAIEAGYFSMTSPQKDAPTLISGFDFAGKFFLLSPGTETTTYANNVNVNAWSLYTHYLTTAYRSRSLNVGTTQVGYSGLGLSYGLNWHLGRVVKLPFTRDLFLNMEYGRDFLSGQATKRLIVSNFMLGLGSVF